LSLMCWMITLGVPRLGISHLRNYRSTRGGIRVSEQSNPAVRALFPASDHLFEITRGGCSCGIGLPEPSRFTSNHDRLLRRYRTAGWSQTKIDRALEDSERAKGRPNHQPYSAEPLRALRSLMATLVNQLGEVRFFAYDDTAGTPFSGDRSSLSLSEFNALRHFPYHVLLAIHR